MNLQKEIQPRKSCKLRKICCFNLTKLTKKSFLEDLKLSILWESAVLYSRYLKRCKYCSHRPWTKYLVTAFPPIFFSRICHYFFAEIYLPYLHFPCVPICCFFNFYSLSSSFMFVVALSFAPHSSTFLFPISLYSITHTELNKKSFTEMPIQISMWNLSFWDPLSGGWC